MSFLQLVSMIYKLKYHAGKQKKQTKPGFSLRILVLGEGCNVTGEYFESGSTSK